MRSADRLKHKLHKEKKILFDRFFCILLFCTEGGVSGPTTTPVPGRSTAMSLEISSHSRRSAQGMGQSVRNGTGAKLWDSDKSMVKPAPGRKVRPSKARHNQKRLCLRIVEKLSNMDPAMISDQQKSSLSWAKGVLENYDAEAKKGTSTPVLEPAEKRQRTPDEKPLSKRPKTRGNPTSKMGGNPTSKMGDHPTSKSFSDVVKDNRVMAIINRGDEDGTIPRGQWAWIVAKLAGVCKQVLEEMPGSPPSCSDAGWYQGRVKLVSFGDDRSVALYRAAISKVGEVFPGAKLDVVSIHDIPSRPRAHVWIPAIPATADGVLDVLRTCNPELPAANWKIGRLGELDGARRQAVILLNAETLTHLTRSKGMVQYGFDTVLLKVYKKDQEVIPVNTDVAVSSNAVENSVAVNDSVVKVVAGKTSEAVCKGDPEVVPVSANTAESSTTVESSVALDASVVREATGKTSESVGPPTVSEDEENCISSDTGLLGNVSGLLGSESEDEDDLLDSTEEDANDTVVEMEVGGGYHQ